MKFIFIIIGAVLLFSFDCNYRRDDKQNTTISNNTMEINLGDSIRIVIPTLGEKFDSCKPYTNIEIWKGNEMVFKDTAQNEYRFLCNDSYTKARKLSDNRYEILIEKFDAPDIDKTFAVYLKDGKYESDKLFPFFEKVPEDIDNDGKEEYYGIMYTIEGYNNDSCYYNPVLYYEVTSNGILLDTSLTKKKIHEVWGEFYGYEQSDKVILPCK